MIFRKFLSILALLISLILGVGFPAGAQVDFPIGYVSRGGTYAFISLIEKHRLLEQEGIKPTFVYIGGPQVSQALISGDIRMAIVAAASANAPGGESEEIWRDAPAAVSHTPDSTPP